MINVVFEPLGEAEAFQKALKKLTSNSKSIIVLACDANGFTKENIDECLKSIEVPLIGGIFPSVIYKNKKYDKGTIILGLDDHINTYSILDISKKDALQIDIEIEQHSENFNKNIETMFVFVDGLTSNIGLCISSLFDNYGLDFNYIGGGTGSLSFEQKPSLLTNNGLILDALIYADSKIKSSIGVKHGWQSISGPYEITKSESTIIHEIDYKPAFEVYKNIVDKFSKEKISADNFFDVAKSFPFGINTISNEKIVRDPIILDGTSLVCVGNIQEGSYVDILRGTEENLIAAAQEASNASKENMKFHQEFILFVDCISRVLYLQEDFNHEIEAVYEDDIEFIGALTFGEIANNGKDYLEFYNKTSVVGRLGYDE